MTPKPNPTNNDRKHNPMIGLQAPGPVSYGAIGTVEFIKAIMAVSAAPIIPDRTKARVSFGMD
jgi:hypothetical protein